MMQNRYEALKKIKKYWDNRKLSLIYPNYYEYGLCNLLEKLQCCCFPFMGDIGHACKGKPYYSGNSSYPLFVSDNLSPLLSYDMSKTKRITFDRRTIYGKARYQLLCDVISYYEKELANGKG